MPGFQPPLCKLLAVQPWPRDFYLSGTNRPVYEMKVMIRLLPRVGMRIKQGLSELSTKTCAWHVSVQ